MKRRTFLMVLVVLHLFAGSTLAMDSENYRLDWFTPMTGSGGDEMISTNYTVHITVGQSVIGTSSGITSDACLGYWCGDWTEYAGIPSILMLLLSD